METVDQHQIAFLKVYEECEALAVQLQPSYSAQYHDVAAMMAMPPSLSNAPFLLQCHFMQQKKRRFEDMKNALSDQRPSADGGKAGDLSKSAATAQGHPEQATEVEPLKKRSKVKENKAPRVTKKKRADAGGARTAAARGTCSGN